MTDLSLALPSRFYGLRIRLVDGIAFVRIGPASLAVGSTKKILAGTLSTWDKGLRALAGLPATEPDTYTDETRPSSLTPRV